MLLSEIEIFYYVVKLKSFSKAAKQLNVSKSFISKKITQLEHELKVKLILRSTRQLTLTQAGESFYHYSANIVREGNEAYTAMNTLQSQASGLLKMTLPPALGLHLLAPMLPTFLKQFPEVSLAVELDNRMVDLIEEGYDLAIRSAMQLKTSNLIAQRIFSFRNIICATKKYLAINGLPRLPSDLASHNCARYSYSKDAAVLTFKPNKHGDKHGQGLEHEHEEIVPINGNFSSNHLDLIKQIVLNDCAMGILPEFMVINECREEKLIKCLPSYSLPDNPLYAIYPDKEFMLPKLKYFLDMLKDYLNHFGNIQ